GAGRTGIFLDWEGNAEIKKTNYSYPLGLGGGLVGGGLGALGTGGTGGGVIAIGIGIGTLIGMCVGYILDNVYSNPATWSFRIRIKACCCAGAFPALTIDVAKHQLLPNNTGYYQEFWRIYPGADNQLLWTDDVVKD